jgi:uncharacterized protein YndB with AHSA1/START domain
MHKVLLLAIAALASPAAAEIKSSSPNSLSLEYRATVPEPPAKLYRMIGQIGQWWSPAHSYSGDATNLSLELRVGGCFCERLPSGGGVEHLRVAYADPGKRIVMTGALGPMLYEAVTGVLDMQISPSGSGSSLLVTYRASGFAANNADKLAPVVDQVIGEQVRRLGEAAAR